jgi:hypothetical protein
MKKIIAERPDIAFFLKLMLLRREPEQYQVAKSITCSKSIKALEDAFDGKPVPKQECASAELDNNITFTEQNGISAVPAIILPDGSIQPGFLEAPALIARIDEAWAKAASPAAQTGSQKAEPSKGKTEGKGQKSDKKP